jgi:hypothetical protein
MEQAFREKQMALSISGNLIIDEEFRSASTGNPNNAVATLSADATLIAYHNGPPRHGPTAI